MLQDVLWSRAPLLAVALGLAVAGVGGCSEMTLGNGTAEPSSSPTYSSSPLAYHAPSRPLAQNCLLSNDQECAREQANQAATEAKLEQIRREEARSREVAMEQAEEQRRATMIAAGLDPETGKGFWCFRGTLGGHELGECRRSEDECIDRLLFRERGGMEMAARKCERHAQAACFSLTRTLEEGERRMCFDEIPACELLRGTVEPEGFVAAPSECEVAS